MADTIKDAALYLDNVFPKWYEKISTSTLNMRATTKCILGQLYGHYWDALDTSRTSESLVYNFKQVYYNSFQERADVDEWLTEINNRLNGVHTTTKPAAPPIEHLDGIFNCLSSWFKALNDAGISNNVCKDIKDLSVAEFIKTVAGPNNIEFIYKKD